MQQEIQLISAPSILGLKPGGVENLPDSLLKSGLRELLKSTLEVIRVKSLNAAYSPERDPVTKVLNAGAIRNFSLSLGRVIADTVAGEKFALVLGGDCSILIAAMYALKGFGNYGLLFLDAHADFYQPEKSITGEEADMDLAIVTGRGPEVLTNINLRLPYVSDHNVIHLGQRDEEETVKYQSQDIRDTPIKRLSLAQIESDGMELTVQQISEFMTKPDIEGFWIHYDTDVLSDTLNPAVDYRLAGGLRFEEVERILQCAFRSSKIAGMTVTIFNPNLDQDESISNSIAESLGRAFNPTITFPKGDSKSL
ncbi:MAG TPA: arginase family protein [Chryseolinea sp.]